MSTGLQTDINAFLFLNSEPGQKLKAIVERESYLYDKSIVFLKPNQQYFQYLEGLGMSSTQILTLEHQFYIHGIDPVFIFERDFAHFEYFVKAVNEGVMDWIKGAWNTISGFGSTIYNSYYDSDSFVMATIHLCLDILTVIPFDYFGLPGIEETAAILNGVIYAIQKRWWEMAISFVAAIPFMGILKAIMPVGKLAEFGGKVIERIWAGDKVGAKTALEAVTSAPGIISKDKSGFFSFISQFMSTAAGGLSALFSKIVEGLAKAVSLVPGDAAKAVRSLETSSFANGLKNLAGDTGQLVDTVVKDETSKLATTVTADSAKAGTEATARKPIIGFGGKAAEDAASVEAGKIPFEQMVALPEIAEILKSPAYQSWSPVVQAKFKDAMINVKLIQTASQLMQKGGSVFGTESAKALGEALVAHTTARPGINFFVKGLTVDGVKTAAEDLLKNPAYINSLERKGEANYLRVIAANPEIFIRGEQAITKNIYLIKALRDGTAGVAKNTGNLSKAFGLFKLYLLSLVRQTGFNCPPGCLPVNGTAQANEQEETQIQIDPVEKIQADLLSKTGISTSDPTVISAFTKSAQTIHDTVTQYTSKTNCNDNCKPVMGIAAQTMPFEQSAATKAFDYRYSQPNAGGSTPLTGKDYSEGLNQSINKTLASLHLPPVETQMMTVYDMVPGYTEKMEFLTIISIENGTAVLDDSYAIQLAEKNVSLLLAKGKITQQQAVQFKNDIETKVNARLVAAGKPAQVTQPTGTVPQVQPNQPQVSGQEEWIKEILGFETSHGYHNFGFTGASATQFSNENDAIAEFKKLYLPYVEDLPAPLQPVAGDFAFNSENPRASLMVAAGVITVANKSQLYVNGKLDNDRVNRMWNSAKTRVIDKFNQDNTAFLDAFDAERLRSYSQTNGAKTHFDEWRERVAASRQQADKLLSTQTKTQPAVLTK